MKRALDLLVSSVALALLTPFFIMIACCIKLKEHGNVFFKQERIGLGGRIFIIYKFRSMTDVAYATKGSFEPGISSRLTKTGRFLRKWKIDELPQLYNVLKGDMSLVGPRPEVQKWVEAYPERWKIVLTVKPGITDNASIEFRNEETLLSESDDPEKTYRDKILPRKLQLYEEYVRNLNFWNDIKLLFRTMVSIIIKK